MASPAPAPPPVTTSPGSASMAAPRNGARRTRPVPGPARRAGPLLVAVLAVVVVAWAGVRSLVPPAPSSSVPAAATGRAVDRPATSAPASDPPMPAATGGRVGGRSDDGRGIDEGAVPEGTTVFDEGVPAVDRLDPRLRTAIRNAGRDAATDGVLVVVNSGWRSRAYQQRLLDEAVARYGSAEEAARWVADPDHSAHVAGDAIDVGPSSAATWLSRHGATYGLCRTYGNEPWHFELHPDASTDGCPAPYPDPTSDPRLHP